MSFSDLGEGSLVCLLSTFLKDFSSKITEQVSIRCHMQPPGKRGKKFYIFVGGHMIKVAAMHIYILKILKIVYSRTTGPIALKLNM